MMNKAQPTVVLARNTYIQLIISTQESKTTFINNKHSIFESINLASYLYRNHLFLYEIFVRQLNLGQQCI